MKLSIGMIVKNEEQNLERCLSSLQPLMKAIPSELIIVDTGSTDHTAEIAKGYTDQVYFHPWENDYAKMRNYTVNYAQGAWFFFIDADEEMLEYEAIIDFLSGENSRQYNAASVKINSLYKTGDHRQYATASVTRLFRRTKTFRFEGAIHEQPVFDPPIFMLDAVLIHHGYVIDDPDLKEQKLKMCGEMEAYAQGVKENIKRLVDQNRFREASALILGYEEIIPDDPDIDRIKALMEANSLRICL